MATIGLDNLYYATITVRNREVELVLTTRATREIAHRYGGLDNLGSALENNDNLGESLSEVIWLIALLANQSVLIHNLTHPGDPQREITVDEVELLTTPGDLAFYREAITAELVKGTRRDIVFWPKRTPTTNSTDESVDATFTRLVYVGISYLNLTQTEVWLMPLGLLLDLVECWKHEKGRAQPYQKVFIDDVIPAGI